MSDTLSLAGVELPWVRTGFFPAAFSLRWNDVEVGSLEWEGVFSSRALARTPTGAWRIRRSGLRGLLLDDADSGQPIGTVQLRVFGSGEVTLPGRQLALRRASLLPPALAFQDDSGSPLVVVRGHIATLFRGGVCRFEPAATTLPEAGLVALLGIYITVRRARRRSNN